MSISWEKSEEVALVQFIALHSELKAGEWPTFGAQHEYWEKAAEFIQETVGTSHKRTSEYLFPSHLSDFTYTPTVTLINVMYCKE